VPADLVDSLSNQVGFDVDDQKVTVEGGVAGPLKDGELTKGRRLVVFGPEGFRPVPKRHRLVIVMGASPKAFFQAMDRLTGAASAKRAQLLRGPLYQEVLEKLNEVKDERRRLAELAVRVGPAAAAGEGGGS
jgi:hypothetical protein